ncbi:MAG: hypothetical protein M3421_10045 [Bacteroidota bacterium]|nr:hypothetical protein [Bacteroidota bacterium]
MAKSLFIILSAIAGVAAGVVIEKKTNWFGNDKSGSNLSEENLKNIDAQVAKGGGLTNEAATGNND